MTRRWAAFTAVFSLLAATGGCPTSPGSQLTDDSPTDEASSAAGNSSSSGGAATDASQNAGNPADRGGPTQPDGNDEGSAALAPAEEFDDCLLPRQEAEWQDRIIALVNLERGRAGLGVVIRNTTLEAQAEQYACEMIHYDFFDHVNPVTRSTLGQRAAQFDYDYSVVGENLAAGQSTPEQAFNDWMNSPGHRQNILDARFTELGVGIRAGGDYGLYWVQEFGRPLNVR